jgi:hypothetical protein
MEMYSKTMPVVNKIIPQSANSTKTLVEFFVFQEIEYQGTKRKEIET